MYLLEQVISFPYISFDVFDTLIYRSVNDFTDIFKLVELNYKEKWNEEIPDFKERRIKAEKIARRNKNEVNLKDIYDHLPYNIDCKKRLKDIEEECEIRNVVPNNLMVSLLKECKQRGKKIVIITDMYLSRNVFNKIFKKIGITYDYLFISGEEGVTKHSGELFNKVLQELNIKPTQIVHIGDDVVSDILQPMKLGIRSLERIQKCNKDIRYRISSFNNNIIGNHLENIIKRGIQNYNDSPEYVLGYAILGPFLWDFCRWLHQIRKDCQLAHLIFIAREGFLIKNIYEKMYPEDANSIDYIYLNKNILRLPLLRTKDQVKRFLQSIPGRSYYRWSDILDYLYIEKKQEVLDKITKKYSNYDLNNKVPVKELLKKSISQEILLFLFDEIKEDIEEQNYILIEYLKACNIVGTKIGLVNNSINGNAQFLLEEFISENKLHSNVLGLQFIKSKKCETLLSTKCRAWINEFRRASYDTYSFFVNSLIFEHLMFEPVGTALKLEGNNDGMINVKCEKSRKERLNDVKIATVQSFALQFIDDYKHNLCYDLQGMGFDLYVKFLKHPSKIDALFIGTIWDDDFGGDSQIIKFERQEGGKSGI